MRSHSMRSSAISFNSTRTTFNFTSFPVDEMKISLASRTKLKSEADFFYRLATGLNLWGTLVWGRSIFWKKIPIF